MTSFIRLVPNIQKLRDEGTDETFFQGRNYASLPPELAERLIAWSFDHPATEQLPSRDAKTDTLRVYVLPTGDIERIEGLVAVIQDFFREIVRSNAAAVEDLPLLSRSLDDFMDTMREIDAVRIILHNGKALKAAEQAAAVFVLHLDEPEED